MKIEKKNNYLCISDINDFSEAAAACSEYSSQEFSAVVFCTDNNFELSDEEKEALISIPMISAVYKKDISSVSLNSLMVFDLRFSDSVFSLNENNSANADKERFALLFGKSRLSALDTPSGSDIEFISVYAESADEYFSRIFKDKSSVQISALAECLTAVRTGNTEKGFEKESLNFFKLIKEKIKE